MQCVADNTLGGIGKGFLIGAVAGFRQGLGPAHQAGVRWATRSAIAQGAATGGLMTFAGAAEGYLVGAGGTLAVYTIGGGASGALVKGTEAFFDAVESCSKVPLQ